MQTNLKPAPVTDKPATATDAATAAPVAPVTDKPAQAVAPVAKPADKPAKPARNKRKPAAKPATDAPATEAIPYKSGTRDAATVAAQATHFAQYSDRDSAYLAFFGSVMRTSGDSATLAQLHNAGTPVAGKPHMRRNPRYTGSAKATDAGAINRLVKAGYFTVSESGNRLRATAKAKSSAIYAKA